MNNRITDVEPVLAEDLKNMFREACQNRRKFICFSIGVILMALAGSAIWWVVGFFSRVV